MIKGFQRENWKVMKLLETDRLILRAWTLEDLYAYAKNPDVGFMQGWKPHESKDESLNALNDYIKDKEKTVRSSYSA